MDTVFLALRVLLSLGVVLGLLWMLQRRFSRGSLAKRSAARPITVVTRQGIGQKASVVIVETEGKRFLLGVTEQSVTVLDSSETADEAPSAKAFELAMVSERRASMGAVAAIGSAGAHRAGALPASEDDAAVEPALTFRPRRSQTQGKQGALGGSILSSATWKQAAAAVRKSS